MERLVHSKRFLTGLTAALLLWLASFPATAGTNDFQNLGFEAANFIPIPGDPYERVEAGAALPGWTVYINTNQLDRILPNTEALSSANVSVMGPWLPPPPYLPALRPIEGNFSVLLQGGSESIYPGLGYDFVKTAIAQNGLVPGDARSLRLKGAWGAFSVSFGGGEWRGRLRLPPRVGPGDGVSCRGFQQSGGLDPIPHGHELGGHRADPGI